MPNASSLKVLSQMSRFLNKMLYDSMCLNGPHRLLIRVLVSECNNFEYCDVSIDDKKIC